MNDKQTGNIIFVQNSAKPNEVNIRANPWLYVGFEKAKATHSIIRYSGPSRKFKIIDSELAPLKQKHKNFALTWFLCIITRQKYQEEYLNIKIKISGKILLVF